MIDEREYMYLKGRVIALETQVQFLYKHLGLEFVSDQAFDDPKMAKVFELVKKGDLMGAIRLHRELYSSDMADAKKAVEELSGRLE